MNAREDRPADSPTRVDQEEVEVEEEAVVDTLTAQVVTVRVVIVLVDLEDVVYATVSRRANVTAEAHADSRTSKIFESL